MESLFKILLESGLPGYAQFILVAALIISNYFFGKKRIKEANDTLKRGKKDLAKTIIESTNLTRSHYEQISHIKIQVSSNQQTQSSNILQLFINSISVQYEKELSALNVDTEESELLILAFNGFLYRLKEALMEQVINFVTSQGFRSDDYQITKDSLGRVSTNISLCVSKTFRESYKKSRFKVEFSDNIPVVNIETMLENLYSQVKKVGVEGELEIKNITKIYELSMQSIIGEL